MADTIPPAGVAILGSGILGLDLAARLSSSDFLRCDLIAGRAQTRGLDLAARLGYPTSTDGIDAVVDIADEIAVVFDVSDAFDHAHHRAALAGHDTLVVNLTPSPEGTMTVPAINLDAVDTDRHLSLITCGAQAALPVLRAIGGHCRPDYAEVVTTAASASVGPATRRNVDEYLETTEAAMCQLGGAPRAKVLASLTPAVPPPSFRVVVTVVSSDEPHAESVGAAVERAATAVRRYAPGYQVDSCVVEGPRTRASVTVRARRGRIAAYAGNVEIINAAAIEVARRRTRPSRCAVTAHG